ncbi:hypothetical protein C8035_v011028 [Colletotrichum spinosum]|uniref:Uncharacterized protein n=1 Tax=Colletotrichum spinosum TaxID=1347390 RepID=A0A4V3HRR1_9PEZI|nr:hypothetical protein C8035_v011028 [Colletotrichum spinosum]
MRYVSIGRKQEAPESRGSIWIREQNGKQNRRGALRCGLGVVQEALTAGAQWWSGLSGSSTLALGGKVSARGEDDVEEVVSTVLEVVG